jgi:hypothetical protein
MSKIKVKIVMNTLTIFFLLTQVTFGQVPEIPYSSNPDITYDGVVDDREYQGLVFDSLTNITLYEVHNGTHLFIALESMGTGWVSIGFGPTGAGMDEANIIFCYILDETSLVIIDEIGVGRQHFPDISRGGDDDILVGAGLERIGLTVIEFLIPMNSGDSLDQQLIPGNTYGFFLAFHESEKNTDIFHTAFSETFNLKISPIPGEPIPIGEPDLTLTYIALGLLLLVVGGFTYGYFTKPKVYRFSEMRKEN